MPERIVHTELGDVEERLLFRSLGVQDDTRPGWVRVLAAFAAVTLALVFGLLTHDQVVPAIGKCASAVAGR